MNTEQVHALLPCPFCGGEPSITKQMDESPWSHDIVLWTQVECDECEAHVGPTCEGFEAEAVDIWNRRAALQSKDRDDVIPAAILLMAERIATDKFEHCTADPIFTVQRHRLITGIDPNYVDSIGWFDEDGNLISGEEAEKIEAKYDETGKEPDGCTRTGYFEEWEHFATYVTMEAAQEFVAKKGDQYRVDVDSGCRNHEWKALRAFLLSIDRARRVKGEGE